MTSDRARYQGKPFLRLLECYVLFSIGELNSKYGRMLEQMTPKLQATYRTASPWHRIVEEQMGFTDALPERLREMWQQSIELERQRGGHIDPESWTRAVVDQNLLGGS